MTATGADPSLLAAWLTARSIARELPPPVVDHSGLRVDTGQPDEWVRWVFPAMSDGLILLGRSINAPACLLKYCGSDEDLRAVLPKRWAIGPLAYFMRGPGGASVTVLPEGCTIKRERAGAVSLVQIRCSRNNVVGSGYAAENDDAFVYDRITVLPAHRRMGIGTALMSELGHARYAPDLPELLVATAEGRKLYEALGWQVVSPYSTAFIPRS